jgi:uncharacterized protein (TIGR03118 family)
MHRFAAVPALAAAVALSYAPHASADLRFRETDLVSDSTGLAANLDTKLVNPWGILLGPNGQIRVADNGSGFSTVYSPTGNSLSPTITIPPPDGANPTGIVANRTSGFVVTSNGKSAPARYLFDSEDGSISGWSPDVDPSNAIAILSTPGAVYKGIAIDGTLSGHFLYAANFNSGAIDVFDSHFTPVNNPGAFTDPDLPSGYGPFNIVNVNGWLYVSYAKQDADKHDDVPGLGFGYVDVFDASGKLLHRLVSQGPLDAPWAMVLAPGGFVSRGPALLVGNFGNGWINAFDPMTGDFIAALQDTSGNPIHISGLWGLALSGGSSDDEDGNSQGGDGNSQGEDGNWQGGSSGMTLYFTAGIFGENHGLLGSLRSVSAGRGEDADDDRGDHALRVSLARANPIHLGDHAGVAFSVTSDAPRAVRLRVYDAAGRLVAEPLHEASVNGSMTARWSGYDSRGKMVRAGSYFYRAVADGGHVASGHLVILP